MITDTELERIERRYGEHLEHERVLYGLPQHATLDIGALISSVRELKAERDEALSRVDELEADAEKVSEEFEGDCWKALRSLLYRLHFDWSDTEPDGVSAEDASDYIATVIDETERDIQRLRARAEAAEAENERLRKALEPFARHIDEMKFDLDNKGNPLPDDDAVGWVYVTNGDFRAARLALENTNG